MWSAFSLLSILPKILRILFRFQFYNIKPKLLKSEQNSSLSSIILKKADHILEMPRLGVFRNYYRENLTSKISFTTKCHKLFQGKKTTLQSCSSSVICRGHPELREELYYIEY